MTSPPTVSIIIPCYNGERFLAQAIDAALTQTYPQCEVIVIDDGSSDGSAAIMRKYAKRIRIVQQANAGLPAARNAGIRVSTGTYLAFLDADDYWQHDFVEKMVLALETSHSAIAYCGWQNVGLPGGRGAPFVPPDYEQLDKLEKMVTGVRWPVHAALTRREVVEALGGFDSRWSTCEDFAFWIRAATLHRLVRVAEVLAFYRHHDGVQMTKKRAVIARNHWLVQREFLAQHSEIANLLGRNRIRSITHGELLKRGYACYWDRDLRSARAIFRTVMASGYGTPSDWKYMLPALLPLPIHQALIHLMDRGQKEKPLSEKD
ncbi:MAG TPA: glycosyltransferase [Sulfuriferula sp.]|nr:glycosyltransferase [Sulfuriferula sp.]